MKHVHPLIVAVVACLFAGITRADEPRHFNHAGALPPGVIGAMQLLRGGPLPGYFQPVEIRGPAGSQISLTDQTGFTPAEPTPVKAAMSIGPVYRLRLTHIPGHAGQELYPTVEVINRLYPPVGEELKFPIPIELSAEDISLALKGKFITRIVYLENPRAAYARAEDPQNQNVFEVGPKDDPLVIADRLGRPMAIVRLGGRTPADPTNPDAAFLFYSPPLLRFPCGDRALEGR